MLLALIRLRFVLDSPYFLQTIHIDLHNLSIRFHNFRNVLLLHYRRQFLALGLHSDYAEVLAGLGVWRPSLSRGGFVDAIVYNYQTVS